MYDYQLLNNLSDFYFKKNEESQKDYFDFLKDYAEEKNQEDYEKFISDKIYNYIYNVLNFKKSDGGSYGECWSDNLIKFQGENKVFPFYEFIKNYYGNFLNDKDWIKIRNLVHQDTKSELDYYGGIEYFTFYKVNLNDLQNLLIDLNIIKIEPVFTLYQYFSNYMNNN